MIQVLRCCQTRFCCRNLPGLQPSQSTHFVFRLMFVSTYTFLRQDHENPDKPGLSTWSRGMRLIIVTMVSFLNATELDCPSHQHPEIKRTWCTKALRKGENDTSGYFWELFESLSQNILTASCVEFVHFVSWSKNTWVHVGFTKNTSILLKQISVIETDQIFGFNGPRRAMARAPRYPSSDFQDLSCEHRPGATWAANSKVCQTLSWSFLGIPAMSVPVEWCNSVESFQNQIFCKLAPESFSHPEKKTRERTNNFCYKRAM